MTGEWSRREFLAGSGGLAGASFCRTGLSGLLAVSAAACSARDAEAKFDVLTADEAREFDALSARLLPTTDTPGAREAGVVWFLDKSFGSIMKDNLEEARDGLDDFQAGLGDLFPDARRFSDLSEADQDRYLATREATPFFEFIRFATLAGFLGMSSYGGNRDQLGWKLIGFGTEHHQAWQSPFGYYDAEYLEAAPNDAAQREKSAGGGE